VSDNEYRSAVRTGADIAFVCMRCKCAIAADVSVFVPRAESTRTSDAGAPGTATWPDAADDDSRTSVSFAVNMSVDPQQPDVEDSIDVDALSDATQPDDDAATATPEFIVQEGASQRGGDLLIESAGFSYNISRRYEQLQTTMYTVLCSAVYRTVNNDENETTHKYSQYIDPEAVNIVGQERTVKANKQHLKVEVQKKVTTDRLSVSFFNEFYIT